MKSNLIFDNVKKELNKPYEDLDFLLLCFRNMLLKNGRKDLAHSVPWIDDKKFSIETFDIDHVRIYTIVFQLLNIVEINGVVQERRSKEDYDLASVRGFWGSFFKRFKSNNITDETIIDAINNSQTEIVLTAHPTQAKRITILDHYRSLYLLIVRNENTMWNKHEKSNIQNDIELCLERIWRTGHVLIEKPTIQDELS